MSSADEQAVGVRYAWQVEPGTDSPIEPGVYEVVVYEGGTYRNLASRRKYTVVEIDGDDETMRYTYTRDDGEHVERVGELHHLAVVDAVGDSPGGLVDKEVRR